MSAIFRACHLAAIAVLATSATMLVCKASAQSTDANGNIIQLKPASAKNEAAATQLLATPLVKNIPGNVSVGPLMANPMTNVSGSAERGMEYYIGFNCLGCHAPNGGGALGPMLSNDNIFKFGPHPAQHYVVISHGEPTGMPAWGTILPDAAIWDIISYIKSISKEPTHSWGTTVSPQVAKSETEQVPYEFVRSTQPWDHLEPFSNAKKPTDHPFSTNKKVMPSQ